MYDIAVIGGGINGCGIARDAAGRGHKVLLVEQNDLASGTSSASTKLIHGGLRYLEHYEFKLVRESLIERETLWSMAPHIIAPMRFVLPHMEARRPAFLIRIGLFLYDHLGGRKLLPASKGLNLTSHSAGEPLARVVKRGFEYSDCRVDDARLVVLNAMDAAARGADIRTRTKMTSARRAGDHWVIELAEISPPSSSTSPAASASASTHQVSARVIVNAAGPWVNEVGKNRLGESGTGGVRLVKGSHIVVPKIFTHDYAYIFQNKDRRIVFAIPYEQDFTLIGTTDVDFKGDPAEALISGEEIDYLCTAISAYFKKPVRPRDVVWSYSGLRPLYDEGEMPAQERTRNYVLEMDAVPGRASLLTIFGGKITTYRHLAEDALQNLGHVLPDAGPPWTAGAALPGGDFPVDGLAQLIRNLNAACPDLDDNLATRLVHAYGTLAHEAIGKAASTADLGEHFGGGLYEREVEHLIAQEWARTADDILWRRSKLGLRFDDSQEARLRDWLGALARLAG